MTNTISVRGLKVGRDELVSLQAWAKKTLEGRKTETQILEKIEELLGEAENLEKNCYWTEYEYVGKAPPKPKAEHLKEIKYLESVLPEIKAVLKEIEALATELKKIEFQDYKFSRIVYTHSNSLHEIGGELKSLIQFYG